MSPIAIILAGGLARRMGGADKCLLPVAGSPILARIVETLRPQCGPIILNANGDPARFAAFGLPVVPDADATFAGPLAGILAGMDFVMSLGPSHSVDGETHIPRHAEERPKGASRRTHPGCASFETAASRLPQDDEVGSFREGHRLLLTVPGDTPHLPPGLVARLAAARGEGPTAIACAASGGRLHPTIALWSLALREDLRRAFAAGERSIGRFARRYPLAVVEWPAEPDPFLNVNAPEDLERAEREAPPPGAGEA